MLRIFLELKKKGYPVGNSEKGLLYIKNWPEPAPVKCFGKKFFIRIEGDGTMRICGRDGFNKGPDASAGVLKAIDLLPEPACSSCWSAARVEFNLLAGGDIRAILDYIGL